MENIQCYFERTKQINFNWFLSSVCEEDGPNIYRISKLLCSVVNLWKRTATKNNSFHTCFQISFYWTFSLLKGELKGFYCNVVIVLGIRTYFEQLHCKNSEAFSHAKVQEIVLPSTLIYIILTERLDAIKSQILFGVNGKDILRKQKMICQSIPRLKKLSFVKYRHGKALTRKMNGLVLIMTFYCGCCTFLLLKNHLLELLECTKRIFFW